MKQRFDLVILILCLGITFFMWRWGIAHDLSGRDRIAEEVQTMTNRMEVYIEHMLDYGAAVTGLYATQDGIDTEDLSQYVKTLIEADEYPAILRISYVEKKGEGSQRAYIVTQVVDREGNIYPPSGANLMLEEKRRRLIEFIEQGAEGGVGWIDQVNNVAEYKGAGFLVTAPVYKQDKLVGLVNLVLAKDEIEKEMEGWIHDDLGWSWWVSEQGVVARGEKTVEGKQIMGQAKIQLPGNSEWGVDLTLADLPSQTWNMFLGIGVIISFFIYAMIYSISSTGIRAEALAKEMTGELLQYKLALDSTNTHVIITDPEGLILYANSAAEKLTGYSFAEMRGSTPRLWGRQMPLEVYQELWRTVKEQKKIYRAEIKNRRKNGELYIASAIISPIIEQQTGKLIGFVGVEEDITSRKAQEDELKRMNELMVGRELKMAELKKELKGTQA